MKYTLDIIIHQPRQKVATLFADPQNFSEWQEGLLSQDLIQGDTGEEGAVSQLLFQMGKREIEMTEVVLENKLPERFTSAYEAKGVYNIVKNIFDEIDGNTTKLTTHNEFRFSGMMKVMGWFMPGAFKKASRKYLASFKHFAENQKSPEE